MTTITHIWPVDLTTDQLRKLLNDGWQLHSVFPTTEGVQWDLCKAP